MGNPRTDMIDKFRKVLDVDLARTPEQIFVNVPVGKLADAALEMVDTLPSVPEFAEDVTSLLRFHSPLTRDDVDQELTFGVLWVTPEGDDAVAFHGTDGKTRQESTVVLPLADAEQFLLAALSTLYHQQGKAVSQE